MSISTATHRTTTTTTHRTAATGVHPVTGRRARRRRSAALAGLVLTVSLAASACGSSGPERVEAPKGRPVATTEAPTGATAAAPAPVGTDPAGTAPGPARVVRADHDLVVHDEPSEASPSRTVGATTEFGSAVALLVTDAREGWVQVLVPGRPVGALGWIAADDGIELRAVTTEVRVDLSARTLTLYDAGVEVLSTQVAVGSPEAPTPTGRFSVTDKLESPNAGGAYGPFALGLSGRSEVLTDFAGGDGQIGIHGTNDPSSIGWDVSHGCIRVPNDVITRLNDLLPLGTPVVVV